jgi:DNA replication protein DnaC
MSEPTTLGASIDDDWLAEMRKRSEGYRLHVESCQERFCDTCNRYKCTECDEPTRDGPKGLCDDCGAAANRARQLAEWHDRLPPRFTWGLAEPKLAALVGAEVMAQARMLFGAERVVFSGNAGCGKTSLAVAMLRELYESAVRPDAKPALVRRAHGAMFVSAYDLSKARARHPLGQGEAPLIDAAMRASTLVIDDLGSERDGFQSAVTEVLYERHAECRTTWVTTWLDEVKARERYGDGIARRLFEGARRIRLGKAGG